MENKCRDCQKSRLAEQSYVTVHYIHASHCTYDRTYVLIILTCFAHQQIQTCVGKMDIPDIAVTEKMTQPAVKCIAAVVPQGPLVLARAKSTIALCN